MQVKVHCFLNLVEGVIHRRDQFLLRIMLESQIKRELRIMGRVENNDLNIY